MTLNKVSWNVMASTCLQLMDYRYKRSNPRKLASQEGRGCSLNSHHSTPAAMYRVLNIKESVNWETCFILRKLSLTPSPGACIIHQIETLAAGKQKMACPVPGSLL